MEQYLNVCKSFIYSEIMTAINKKRLTQTLLKIYLRMSCYHYDYKHKREFLEIDIATEIGETKENVSKVIKILSQYGYFVYEDGIAHFHKINAYN